MQSAFYLSLDELYEKIECFPAKSGQCIMCLTLKWCFGSPNPINLSKAVREKPIA